MTAKERYNYIDDLIKEYQAYINDPTGKYQVSINNAVKNLLIELIPELKENKKIYNKNKLSIAEPVKIEENTYIYGLYEAYIKNSSINVRTTNIEKINSLIFDIRSYVNNYLGKLKYSY